MAFFSEDYPVFRDTLFKVCGCLFAGLEQSFFI
ncbi:hypothetical protein EV202_11720 [Bacteroides heparinolyticus]|uniref:Uncharacterized protein n=1 Tax=Prevotella heparinolytica TaxID=28113 RepID=A0A4R2LHE7_9BACE|nr:hypothetical protein EV202_11720 [Bacteroides heparinolyticus]